MKNFKPILVVDDNASIRMTMQQLLESEGHLVLTANNGQHAFEVLATETTPALIFLDIMMPVMNGYEFLKQLRANPKYASIVVIVMSATEKASDIVGANHFLQKPPGIESILSFANQYSSSN